MSPCCAPLLAEKPGGAGITGGEVQQGGTFFFGKEAKFFFNGFAGMKNFPGEVQQGGTTRGGGGAWFTPSRPQIHPSYKGTGAPGSREGGVSSISVALFQPPP